MIDFNTMNEQELQQHHTSIARKLRKLTGDKQTIGSSDQPGYIIELAKIDAELDDLQQERRACAAELLKRDQDRNARVSQELEEAAQEAINLTADLVFDLPPLLAAVSSAFGELGAKYRVLHEQSVKLQQIERRLLNSRVNSPVVGACRLAPVQIDKLIKIEIAKAFGAGVISSYIGNLTQAMLEKQEIPAFDLLSFLPDTKEADMDEAEAS